MTFVEWLILALIALSVGLLWWLALSVSRPATRAGDDMTALYDIIIMNREGRTTVHDLQVTDDRAATLRWLVSVVEPASKGDGRPTLTIQPSPERPEGELCTECWNPIPVDAPRVRDNFGQWVHDVCHEVAW